MNNELLTLDKFESSMQQIGKHFEKIDGHFEQIDQRFMQIDRRFEQIDRRFGEIDKRFEGVDKRFEGIDKRFDKVDEEIRGLGVLMEAMDDKFTLISEGQDVIHDVLETRVAHIEDILEIKGTV